MGWEPLAAAPIARRRCAGVARAAAGIVREDLRVRRGAAAVRRGARPHRRAGEWRAIATGDLGHVNLVVHSGLTRIAFALTRDDHTISATILVNDRLFATVTGNHRDPEIRGAGGHELTAAEVEALQGILRLVGAVFELFGNLLKPVGAILALSTIP